MRKNVILIGVVMLMALPAYAHLYDNDFEGHTPTVSVNDEQHEGWNWYTPGAAGVFATDPVEGDVCVDLGVGQTHLNIHGYGAPDSYLTEMHLNYEFDILIDDYNRWDLYWTDNQTSDVISTTFNWGGNNSTVRYKWDDGSGQVTELVPVPGFVTGQWVHASIQLDQLGERWSMNLAGTQICTDQYLRAPPNWAIDTERMIFEVPSGGGVYIDNLTITEIPEPATCLLLGLGGLLLRRKRK